MRAWRGTDPATPCEAAWLKTPRPAGRLWALDLFGPFHWHRDTTSGTVAWNGHAPRGTVSKWCRAVSSTGAISSLERKNKVREHFQRIAPQWENPPPAQPNGAFLSKRAANIKENPADRAIAVFAFRLFDRNTGEKKTRARYTALIARRGPQSGSGAGPRRGSVGDMHLGRFRLPEMAVCLCPCRTPAFSKTPTLIHRC